MVKTNGNGEKVKSMESWIWDAACSIRGAADAPKFKEFILPPKFQSINNHLFSMDTIPSNGAI